MPLRQLRSLAAAVAAAVVSALPGTLAHAQGQPEILIGALLPLTGPAAPVGLEQQQGVQFAVDRANAAGGRRSSRTARPSRTWRCCRSTASPTSRTSR